MTSSSFRFWKNLHLPFPLDSISSIFLLYPVKPTLDSFSCFLLLPPFEPSSSSLSHSLNLMKMMTLLISSYVKTPILIIFILNISIHELYGTTGQWSSLSFFIKLCFLRFYSSITSFGSNANKLCLVGFYI